MIFFVMVSYFIAIVYDDFNHRTENWNSTCRLICRCAKAAGKKGYDFFGIQHYGECWSSADAASRFHIYGPNDECINNEFKSCDNLASDGACSGVNYVNYVYEIFPRKYVCCCMQWVASNTKCNKKNKMYQQTNSMLIFYFDHLSWFRESC